MMRVTDSQSDYNASTFYLIALSATLGSVAWGYNLTVFNSLRLFLQRNVFPDASEQTIANLASVVNLVAIAGSYFAGRFVSSYGRRKTLLMADVVGIIGSCCCIIHSLPIIFVGRILIGFSIGINSAVMPLYNVEMSPLALKGKMGAISVAMLSSGLLLGFAMEFFVPDLVEGKDSQIWRLLFGFAAIFHVTRIAILTRVYNFDTPIYLVLNDKIGEAKEVLSRFYTANIEEHLERVIRDKEAILSGGTLTIKDLFTPKYRNATLMAFLCIAGTQMNGFTPIIMFCNMFIKDSAGGDPETIKLFSNLWGFVSFAFTITTTLIVERFGRRSLMITFTACLFVTKFVFALITFIDGPSNPLLKYLLVFLWPAFYRLSAGTLAFGYCSEVLPSIGVSVALVFCWILGFLTVQTFIPLSKVFGIGGLMFIWSLFCLGSAIVFYKYLLESKGKTKAELLELYRGLTKEKNNQIEMSSLIPKV